MKRKRLATLIALLTTSVLCVTSTATAQMFYSSPRSPTSAKQKTKATSLEGAALQTVSEQEQFKLRRAKEFAEEGDSRSAIALWQSVLDSAGSQLITRNEWKFSSKRHTYPKYVTVAHEIESILSDLSPDGLDAYRLRADGEARAILANPNGRSRTEVLSEVVRRFFVSSIGDEAAFELACLKLDRFEFTGASRLLRKCLEEHPDCTVPKNEILLRLAVANGRIGDAKAAQHALKQMSNHQDDEQRIDVVRTDVSNTNSRTVASAANDSWPSKYGSADRTASMRAIPEAAFTQDLSELWSQEFDVYTTTAAVNPAALASYGALGRFITTYGRTPGNSSPKLTKPTRSKVARGLLIDQWRQSGWRPVSGLLFREGLLYFKRDNRVMCCSTRSGEMVWMGMKNEFAIDPLTQRKKSVGLSMGVQRSGSTGQLGKAEEIQLFGDHVHQAMSIGHGNVYSIEGRTELDAQPVVAQPSSPYVAFNVSLPPRARRNWLCAYHATSGKLQWRRTARDQDVQDSKFDVGFTSAPVSGGGLTYVTINDAGAVWLLALNPKDGATTWKTFLCEEPAGACSAWATSGIAYADGDVYIGTGAGIVAAVDGVAGALRWAVRYERTGDSTALPNPYGTAVQMGDVNGWREDVVVATGRALVVMGSDSSDIFALDQRSGRLLWDSPRSLSKKAPADYYLGMQANRLYVGGKNVVRCYDAAAGRVLWERPIEEGSSGTGIVTEDALYVPERNSIVKLSPETGRELKRSKLVTVTEEPVGNLYSDGNRLFGVGMARAYALTDLDGRLEDLDTRAANNEVDAVLKRGRFRAFREDIPGTWEDVNRAYTLLSRATPDNPTDNLSPHACEVVLGLLSEFNLPGQTPGKALQLLSQMSTDLAASGTRSEQLHAQIEDQLYRALTSIHFHRTSGLTAQVLAVARLCSKDHLTRKACLAIAATCSSDDLAPLTKLLTSKHLATQQIAAAGLAKLDAPGHKPLLAVLKGDTPDKLRLHATIALVNAGHTDALSNLAQLLASKDTAVRKRALHALQAITGQTSEGGPQGKGLKIDVGPQLPDLAAVSQWESWLAARTEKQKLTLPYVVGPYLRGRTLVSYASGQVQEYDLKGKKTWSKKLTGAVAASGVSNGNRLLASMTNKRITEYGPDGKQVWSIHVEGYPTRAYRLDNENTLVSTRLPGKVLEYRKDGSIAWEYATSGDILDARRLDNGNTLIALMEGTLIQVNAAGKLVWSQSGLSTLASAQPLPNGNILIALPMQKKIIEVNSDFETVWSKTGLTAVSDAMRLADGNTLVASSLGITTYSPKGKQVGRRIPHSVTNNKSQQIYSSGFSGEWAVVNGQQHSCRVYRY